MSQQMQVRNMVVPGSVTTGAAVYIGDLDPATVVFSVGGTATATYHYEVSIDGVNYFQCGAALAETGAFTNLTPMATAGSNPAAAAVWARCNTTAFTSAGVPPTMTVAGLPRKST